MKIDKNRPLIVVNFKDYEESTGDNAVSLAEKCQKVAIETGVQIIVAVHPFDMRAVMLTCRDLFVICQTGDSYSRNKKGEVNPTQTGRITPRMILSSGAHGVLINHAENPKNIDEIREIVGDFKFENPGLIKIVCAEDSFVAAEIADGSDCDFIAIEPPDLIGGDVSVTTRPQVVKDALEKVRKPLLVGAGVKTGEDVAKALDFGAKGVLLASGVVRPKGGRSPEDVLRELANSAK